MRARPPHPADRVRPLARRIGPCRHRERAAELPADGFGYRQEVPGV